MRIPEVFEFKGINEVDIQKHGDKLIIRPKRRNWFSFAELPTAGDDFMSERPELLNMDKVSL